MTLTRAQLNQIKNQRERATLAAFNEVVSSIRDQAIIAEIVAQLNIGSVQGVIDLLQLDAATYAPLSDAILESYRTGGITGAQQVGRIPTDEGTLVARFNTRSPAAEQWAATLSSKMVVEIIEPQRELIRTVVTQGLANGQNPRAIALDVIGRVDNRTGRRVGGFMGLTEQQGGWILNARNELLELDPNYFTRALRDQRFDGAIERAMKNGSIPDDLMTKALTNMQNRALRYRGETIARTEALSALTAGQHEAVAQAVDKANVADSEITREWIDGGDGRVRPDHAHVEPVTGMDTPFNVGGVLMMYPRDESAPAEQVIQCRCMERTKINWGKRAARIDGFN